MWLFFVRPFNFHLTLLRKAIILFLLFECSFSVQKIQILLRALCKYCLWLHSLSITILHHMKHRYSSNDPENLFIFRIRNLKQNKLLIQLRNIHIYGPYIHISIGDVDLTIFYDIPNTKECWHPLLISQRYY